MSTSTRIPTTLGRVGEYDLDEYIREHVWSIYEELALIAKDPAARRAHTAALWVIPEQLRILVRQHCNLYGELFLDSVLKEYGKDAEYPRHLFSEKDVMALAQALGFSMRVRYEALADHINSSARHEVSELPTVIMFYGQTQPDGSSGRLWLAAST